LHDGCVVKSEHVRDVDNDAMITIAMTNDMTEATIEAMPKILAYPPFAMKAQPAHHIGQQIHPAMNTMIAYMSSAAVSAVTTEVMMMGVP